MNIVHGLAELERGPTLRVAEIFHSLQGEGAATGRAATFVWPVATALAISATRTFRRSRN